MGSVERLSCILLVELEFAQSKNFPSNDPSLRCLGLGLEGRGLVCKTYSWRPALSL